MSIKHHHYEIHGDVRSLKTKAKSLIEEGLIPGILYNIKGEESSIPVSIKYNTLATKLSDPCLLTRVIKLSIDKKQYDVIIREIKFHPVKNTIIHVDFMVVYKDLKIRMNVPIKPVNYDKCPGIKTGGDYYVVQYSTPIVGPIQDIPNHLDADLTGKKIGDQISTSDISIPSTCKFIRPGLLVRVSGKRVIEEKTDTTAATTDASKPAEATK